MKHLGKDEFLRDVEARQRNIVFPDTLNNETRGWRNLMESRHPTLIQKLGMLVLLLFVGGFAVGSAYFVTNGFSKQGLPVLALVCAGTFIFVGLILIALRIGIADATRDIRRHHKNSGS